MLFDRRIVAESWPKVWRMMGSLRSTNLQELSAHTTINKPHGLSLHLIPNGAGKRDEELYVKICESMSNNTVECFRLSFLFSF